jgi:two-component system sensor histidine kinase PilS (NtrC family)
VTDLESTYISSNRQRSVLTFFHLYRVALALLLLAMVRFNLLSTVSSEISTQQTLSVQILLYIVLAIISMWLTIKPELSQISLVAIFLTDVVMLLLIIRTSGGISGGFGNLVLVSVSAGAVFLSTRNGLLMAAVAASGIVYSEIQMGYGRQQQYFLQAAMLGIAFFSVTFLIQFILKRARESEAIAISHAGNIMDLQAVNAMVLDRMRTGIVVCSANGNIRMINHAALILMTNDADNHNPTTAPPELVDRIRAWLLKDESLPNNVRFDRDLPDVSLTFAVLQNTPNSDVVVFMEDTSNTRQQAQQLKLASLGRLTASIAHEIRNPLGAISHAAQLLDESPSLDPTDNRMLHIIQMHTKRMNNIIENVLQLSRNSKSTPEYFMLLPWLNQFESDYHELDRTAHFTIHCANDLGIRFDQGQLQQVVENLVNNGLRYSRQKNNLGTITLEAGILNANEQPYLDIVDNGPGLNPEQEAHIFEPFFTTEKVGTGLGLFLCKELSEANQARLEWVPPLIAGSEGCRFRLLFVHPQRHQLDAS